MDLVIKKGAEINEASKQTHLRSR